MHHVTHQTYPRTQHYQINIKQGIQQKHHILKDQLMKNVPTEDICIFEFGLESGIDVLRILSINLFRLFLSSKKEIVYVLKIWITTFSTET